MPIGSFSITNKSGAPLTAGFYPGQVIEGLVSLTVTDGHMKCKGRYLNDVHNNSVLFPPPLCLQTHPI